METTLQCKARSRFDLHTHYCVDIEQGIVPVGFAKGVMHPTLVQSSCYWPAVHLRICDQALSNESLSDPNVSCNETECKPSDLTVSST